MGAEDRDVKRSLVLVAIVAMACSRHPLEREDGGDAGAAGVGAAAGGIGGAASGGIGGAASGGTSGIGGTANGGASGGMGGTSAGGSGGVASGGTGGVASGGGGAAGAGAVGGMAGSSAGCGAAGGAVGACGKVPGQPCVASAECAFGPCVDGVCCSGQCAGPCVSCNQAGSAGRCTAVPPGAPDPRGLCVDTGPVTCGFDGRCDGAAGCRRYPTGTLCAAETCSGDVFTPPSVCNAAGACVRPASVSCAPYKCGPQSCISFCTVDPDCSFGVCLNGQCRRPGGGAPCLNNNECNSGFCAQGVCCASACTGPCRSCALAGTAGICTPVPNPDPSWNCSSGG